MLKLLIGADICMPYTCHCPVPKILEVFIFEVPHLSRINSKRKIKL